MSATLTIEGASEAPNVFTYDAGTVVNATAVPDTNWIFDHWILDGTNTTTNPYPVTMDADHTLQAVFVATSPIPNNNNNAVLIAVLIAAAVLLL